MTSTKKNSNKGKIYLKIIHILLYTILIFIAVLAFLMTILVKMRFFVYKEYLDYYLDKPVLVICLGFICLIAIGWLGVISVAQSYLNGIITSTVLLFGHFMFTIALVGFGAATAKFAAAATYSTLEDHMSNYTYHAVSINCLQSDLSCCGIYSSDEWINLLGSIPGSCCNSNSTCDTTDVDFPGCYTTLKSLMNNYIWLLCMVLIVLCIIKIITMMLSCVLIRVIRNADKAEPIDLTKNSTEIPRVQNTLVQIREPQVEPQAEPHESTRQNSMVRNYESPPNTYVRHSSHRPLNLNYRSRHENYLSSPAQLRFDRRYILQHNIKALEHPRKVYG